jgi:hypothetical protein
MTPTRPTLRDVPITLIPVGPSQPGRALALPPLSRRCLRALPDGECVVQFPRPLADNDHALLGEWFAAHPAAELRAYATGASPSLDFLRHYPTLRRFTIDTAYAPVEDASGLGYLPDDLERLVIEVPLPRRGDDDTLARFRRLTALRLGGTRRLPESMRRLTALTDLAVMGPVPSLAALSDLTGLRTLELRSVSCDLEPIRALRRLEELTLTLGGVRDLAPVSGLPRLRRFAARLVRGLADVEPLARVEHLEVLGLDKLKQVTRLPDLSHARALGEVALTHLRGLRDLTPLRRAPALRVLRLVEMEHLRPADVAVLAGHPTLRELYVGLGNDRKNLAARDALRITGAYGGHLWPPDDGPTLG